MVSQCANPECNEPFIYFRSGRLFAVPRDCGSATRATVEYFWLCERCSQVLQPEFTHAHGQLLWLSAYRNMTENHCM
jgi:hypothetical protein